MYGLPKMHITLSNLGFWRVFRPRDIPQKPAQQRATRASYRLYKDSCHERFKENGGKNVAVPHFLMKDSCQTEAQSVFFPY